MAIKDTSIIKYCIVGFTSNIDLDRMIAKVRVLDKTENWTDSLDVKEYMLFNTWEDADDYVRKHGYADCNYVIYGVDINEAK